MEMCYSVLQHAAYQKMYREHFRKMYREHFRSDQKMGIKVIISLFFSTDASLSRLVWNGFCSVHWLYRFNYKDFLMNKKKQEQNAFAWISLSTLLHGGIVVGVAVATTMGIKQKNEGMGDVAIVNFEVNSPKGVQTVQPDVGPIKKQEIKKPKDIKDKSKATVVLKKKKKAKKITKKAVKKKSKKIKKKIAKVLPKKSKKPIAKPIAETLPNQAIVEEKLRTKELQKQNALEKEKRIEMEKALVAAKALEDFKEKARAKEKERLKKEEQLAAEKEAADKKAKEEAMIAAKAKADADAKAKADALQAQKATQVTGSAAKGSNAKTDQAYGVAVGLKDARNLRQIPGNQKPVYPERARLLKQKGKVVLVYFVTKSGKVQKVQMKSSSGYRSLDLSAVKGISKYRYYPGQEGWVEHPIDFSLKGPAKASYGRLRSSVSGSK